MLINCSVDARNTNLPYVVVDTGQYQCFGNRGPIRFPKPDAPFFGQDAQYDGNIPAYRDNRDGTITDLNTGLIWEKKPDFVKRSWPDAMKHAESLVLAGKSDWRLPTIKELFSLADFRGSIRTMTPYIDTKYFAFKYPDTSKGYRIIDAQYWSSNQYVGTAMFGDISAFGFNFADGRIKAYPTPTGKRRRPAYRDRRFVRCVRGPTYGENDFVDNGDGTITDRATGLMWTKKDNGKAMNWEQALTYAENLKLAGYDDWRLPNVKELQSIVDYGRAPEARPPAPRGPAIDPIFDLTSKESWFWSGTTFEETGGALYVCFGRGMSAWRRGGKQVNAHGAGAVRSDPKAGNPGRWPNGRGPQGDEIRINNYVRCVRGGVADLREHPNPKMGPLKSFRNTALGRDPNSVWPPRRGRERMGRQGPPNRQGPQGMGPPQGTGPPNRQGPQGMGPGRDMGPPTGGAGHAKRFIRRLDTNGDGKVSQDEFDGPSHHFPWLDQNGDGYIDESEAERVPPPPGRRPPRRGVPGYR